MPPPSYKSLIPFPQRLMKPNIEDHFREFVEVLKKLYIIIPFTEELSYMPSYAIFLKEILSNKRKLEDTYIIVLNKSTILSFEMNCPKN